MVGELLKVVCGWCGCIIRDGKLPASHGMCYRCRDRFLAQMEDDDGKRK